MSGPSWGSVLRLCYAQSGTERAGARCRRSSVASVRARAPPSRAPTQVGERSGFQGFRISGFRVSRARSSGLRAQGSGCVCGGGQPYHAPTQVAERSALQHFRVHGSRFR
eukprot:1578018-Rhodomonas_salina.1